MEENLTVKQFIKKFYGDKDMYKAPKSTKSDNKYLADIVSYMLQNGYVFNTDKTRAVTMELVNGNKGATAFYQAKIGKDAVKDQLEKGEMTLYSLSLKDNVLGDFITIRNDMNRDELDWVAFNALTRVTRADTQQNKFEKIIDQIKAVGGVEQALTYSFAFNDLTKEQEQSNIDKGIKSMEDFIAENGSETLAPIYEDCIKDLDASNVK